MRQKTQDGTGDMVRGERGDLMLYCAKCDCNDPLLTAVSTDEGKHFSAKHKRWRGSELYITDEKPAIQIVCPECHANVLVTFAEIKAALTIIKTGSD
jgi:hypothetical protein